MANFKKDHLESLTELINFTINFMEKTKKLTGLANFKREHLEALHS